MNLDEDIIIENKYGADRHINELLDIDDVNIKDNKESDKNSIHYKDFQIPQKSTVYNKENQKEIKKSQNQDNFKVYIKSSFVAVIFITSLSVVIMLTKGDIRNTIWGALRTPIEAIIFLILSFYIVRIKKQIPKISGLTCALAGFFSGVFISIFKLFYHMELWTIFNVATESIFLGALGFVLGLIFGALLYGVDDSLKNI